MAAYFFDSSSLVKRFAREKGSVWVLNVFRRKPPHAFFAARITFVEVISALGRKVRNGEINADSEIRAFRRLWRIFEYGIENVEITSSLIQYASDLTRKHLLRAYDAVQLACRTKNFSCKNRGRLVRAYLRLRRQCAQYSGVIGRFDS